MCNTWVITRYYAAAQLVKFDNISDMILGVDSEDVINVCIESKIERKTRKCDDSGLKGSDAVTIVSEPEDKVYSVV